MNNRSRGEQIRPESGGATFRRQNGHLRRWPRRCRGRKLTGARLHDLDLVGRLGARLLRHPTADLGRLSGGLVP